MLNLARRAIPVVTPLTAPFWEGAGRGELVMQRCGNCGRFEHPPYPECTRCHFMSKRYEAVSGHGVVAARSIVASPIVGDWEDAVPYGCFVIQLQEDEDLFVAGNIVDVDPYAVPVGAAVEVVFEPLGEGFTIPLFRLASQPGAAAEDGAR